MGIKNKKWKMEKYFILGMLRGIYLYIIYFSFFPKYTPYIIYSITYIIYSYIIYSITYIVYLINSKIYFQKGSKSVDFLIWLW